MSSGITPSQLLEIRRVKAMIAGAGTTMDSQCFLGPTGPTGPTGPPGAKGNYGIPSSLGYYNNTSQLIANATPGLVTWVNRDDNFSQGITGIDYSIGKFYNDSPDSILANVTGFISFTPNPTGVRAVYAQVNGVVGNIYGYTQVSAASTVNQQNQQSASSSTIVPFSFNVYLAASVNTFTYFELFAYQDSGYPGGLTINSSTSRISITRINTTMQGIPGPPSVFLGAAEFYALAPSSQIILVSGDAIAFPQNGPIIGSTIIRNSNTEFKLVDIGIYSVSFYLNATEAGKLCISLDGVQQQSTIVEKENGTPFYQTCLIQTTNTNKLLTIRNASLTSPSLLTIAGNSSTNIPVSARITITRYS